MQQELSLAPTVFLMKASKAVAKKDV